MLTLRHIREIRYTIDGSADVTIEKSVRLIGKGVQDVKNQVYLNNPTACPRKIKATILADFFAKNFYSKVLGIQNYDLFQEIQDEILPQYVDNPAQITDDLNLSHIKIIQKAFVENNSRAKQLLRDAPFLKSTQGTWAAPSSLFIEASYFRTKPKEYYLLDKLDVTWLSPIYKQKVPVDAFVQFGCKCSLGFVSIPDSDYDELLSSYNADMYEQYCTGIKSKNHVSSRDNYDWKRNIEYLPYKMPDLGLDGSVALAEYLSHNINTFMMNGTVFAANDAAMRGKTLYQIENLKCRRIERFLQNKVKPHGVHWMPLLTKNGKKLSLSTKSKLRKCVNSERLHTSKIMRAVWRLCKRSLATQLMISLFV